MQHNKKEMILKALSSACKKFRGKKSQKLLGDEYDIPSSVISDIERVTKDPQLTTLFKLSHAFNISLSDFIKEIENNLPKDFWLDD